MRIGRKKGSAGSSAAGEPAQAALCPNCGRALPEGASFCPACGWNVGRPGRRAKNPKKGKRRVKREMERLAGEQCAQCTNDLVGFKHLFESGIAETSTGRFCVTLEFGDIAYENERKDVKDSIFDKYEDLHTSMKEGSCFQINLLTLPTRTAKVDRFLPETGANREEARAYNDIIEERQKEGRTEFVRRNLITVAVDALDDESAGSQLAAARESLAARFDRLHVKCRQLRGMEKMEVMHALLRGPEEPMFFDYGRLRRTKRLHARDFVAPSWAVYPESERMLRRCIMLPGRCVKSYLIRDFGSSLSDRAIRSIRSLPIPMNISLLYVPQPTGKVSTRIRQNIDVVQAEIFDYQKGTAKSGGDITILPPALENKEAESRELLEFIQENDQSVSWFQGIITVFAATPAELDRYDRILMDEKSTWAIDIIELPLKQEPAFTSALPLATTRLPKNFRSLTSAEAATMIPFSSQNITDDPKRSLMLGVDRVSNDAILIDPDKLKSPHGWIFGMTGAGKGMTVNSIITYALSQHPRTEIDPATGEATCPEADCPQWHVFDFHGEYLELARRFGASVSYFGPGHSSCLNPMDMANAAGELVVKDVRANTDFFIALFESMMDRMLSQREKSMLDRCLGTMYEPHVGKETRPTLKDLYATLRAERNPVAEELADSLEMYAQGSMDSFAGQTNVRTSPYFNLYVMSDLGKTMQTLGMMSTLQHVRKCTYANYRIGKPTYLLVEECQILFGNDAAVRMLDDYFSELRKFGLHIMCVTQLPSRVLEHPLAANLFENSGWFVLLPQQAKNVSLISETFHLSKSQESRIAASSEPGSGLVVADGLKIAMRNTIPKDNLLYEIWNTDPYKQAKKTTVA